MRLSRDRRVMVRGAATALLLLCLAASLPTALETAAAGTAGWHETSRDGITVTFREEDGRAAELILEMAVERGPALAEAVSLGTVVPVRIVVAPTHEDFEQRTMGGAPDWWVGCAFPSRGLVVMKSPRIVTYPLHMEEVLVHELAHVAAGRVLGEVWAPRWFHEGVAMSIAGEWRLSQVPSLTAAARSGTLIPLRDLETRFPDSSAGAALAYAESFRAVAFLMERAGLSRAEELVLAVREAGGFDAALEVLYGGDRDDFGRDAIAHFGERYSWGLLFTRWDFFLVAATVLFLVALVVRVGRARRRMREWDEEERQESARRNRPSGSSWQ
jgi:hypothetical protein